MGRADIFGPDDPAMGLHDLLRDGKPQTGMLAEIAGGPFGIEAREDFLQRLFGNAGAGILDHHQDAVVAPAHPDPDRIAILAKGNGIGDQIDEDLRQPPLQTGDADRLGREVGDEVNAFFLGLFTEMLGLIAEGMGEIEFLLLLPDQFAVEARGIGNIADQPVHALDVMLDNFQ